MPWTARRILHAADLEAVVHARRNNFLTIHENLRETRKLRKIFSCLPDDVCPWAYPVILIGRSEIDYRLRGMEVPLFTFGEVLHPHLYAVHRSNGAQVASAEFLSQNLLCFSVHQNLTHSQVSEFCEKINRFMRNLS
jgi:dTDP-4-amino-4,6-dideoxygalactose transaminase